jgi:uncharacterized membrane protein YdjX (TVP38/TMEM64 family)
MTPNRKKLALLLAVVLLVAAAHRLGLFGLFGDAATAKRTLLDLGPLGYAAYLAAFALLQPFGVPGFVFVIAASLVWPTSTAIGLSLVGSCFASMVGFSFARYVARDWVEKKIPARWRKYDERLAERGFATVLLLRLIFWQQPLLHLALGLSRVRFSSHLGASMIAYVGPIVATCYFGEAFFTAIREQPAERWAAAGVVLVALVAILFAVRRYRKARAAATASSSVNTPS